jgi:outer membrane lipoprotein
MRWRHEATSLIPWGVEGGSRQSWLLAVAAVLLFSAICLQACSVIPREVRKEVDGTLSFRELKEDPEAHAGKKVALGGEIVETRNFPDESLIEVLQKRLRAGDVPEETDESEGRFLVSHPGYLDPAIYRSGRYVTVVGEVRGSRTLRIGEADYRYPVLSSIFLYLWPRREIFYGPYHYYPYYYPPYYPYGVFWFYYPYPVWPYWYYNPPPKHIRKK